MKKLIIPFLSLLVVTFVASCASQKPVTQTTTTTRETVAEPTAKTQTTTTHSSTNY